MLNNIITDYVVQTNHNIKWNSEKVINSDQTRPPDGSREPVGFVGKKRTLFTLKLSFRFYSLLFLSLFTILSDSLLFLSLFTILSASKINVYKILVPLITCHKESKTEHFLPSVCNQRDSCWFFFKILYAFEMGHAFQNTVGKKQLSLI